MGRKLHPNNRCKTQKKEQERRRSEPKEKNAKPKVDESKEKTAEEARTIILGFLVTMRENLTSSI